MRNLRVGTKLKCVKWGLTMSMAPEGLYFHKREGSMYKIMVRGDKYWRLDEDLGKWPRKSFINYNTTWYRANMNEYIMKCKI